MLQCKTYNNAHMNALHQVGKDPKGEEPKPKRPMRSFEADDDVERMLKRAKRKHINIVWICNTAVRKYLIEKGYARKKDLA